MRALDRVLFFAACLVVACVHVWTVRSTDASWNWGEEQRDYYNRLIDGWLDGQLHMKVDVPAALLALKNPYDPGERPRGLGLHDASFYQGKYYLYFGAAPMVTVMLPFRVVTGVDLPQPVAVLVFVYGGFLASVAVWRAVQRRYFPESGALVTVTAVLVLGVANSGLVLLRRPDMWELPIAGGACFAMLMLGCVWRSLHAERRRGWWFAGAGLCLGLAIASRPTYLLASPCLAAPLLAWWRAEKRIPWRWAAWAVGPLAVVGALMAGHNYARFGDPLQFGQAYQFSLDYESKLPHFALSYVPFNLNAHFFAGAEWSRYFPFIGRPDHGPAPVGYTIHRGDVYGLLANLPISCLALLAPLAVWRRTADERRALGAWLATAGLLFALAGGVMVLFFSALARYQGEFAPAFLLLAMVGLLGLERGLLLRAGAGVRAAGRGVWVAAAAFSLGFGWLYSVQYDGLLREQNPRLERALARTLNHVPAAWERLAGQTPGAIEFTLRLPGDSRVGDETLLSVGDPPRVDRVFLRTRTDGRIQLGVTPAGAPERLGRPLTLDRAGRHHVRVSLGSLLPPASHPVFAGWSDEQVRRALRAIRIDVDGEAALQDRHRFPDAAARRVRTGRRALGSEAYPRFQGVVEEERRVPLAPAADNERDPLAGPGDTLRLRVKFPAGRREGREPLVVTGTTGAGDMLLVEYQPDGRVRFAHDHWGSPLRLSPPVTVRTDRAHEIEVSLGSLRVVPDATQVGAMPLGRVRVAIDGAVVWDESAHVYPAEAGEVHVGRNPIGGTSAGPLFSGEILAVERVGRD